MRGSIEADRELPRKLDLVAHRLRAFPQAGTALSSIEPSSFSWLVENHHLGDEGVDVAGMCQAASRSDRAKVLFEIADIVGLVIALRKKLEHAVVVWRIAELKGVHDDEAAAGLSTRATRKTLRRTLVGNSWNMKTLVTASWLSFGTGIASPFATMRLIHQCFK
jgi:hypothetical protein